MAQQRKLQRKQSPPAPIVEPADSPSTADWANLSPNVISKIFRELEDPNDRTNAALVCKRWSEAFASPELWRTLSFQVIGSVTRNSQEENALTFAHNFGQYVRELQIVCFASVTLGHRSQENLIRVIEILAEKSSQIRTFSLTSLHLNRYWRDRKGKMMKTLSSFLMSQNQIRNFSMAHLNSEPISEGLELLESILDKNRKKIERLDLQNYFADNSIALNSSRYRDVIRSFETLVELTLNYGALDQLLLKDLVENCSRTLKVLKITCRSSDNNAHSITPEIWTRVVEVCPDLEVEIHIIRVPLFLRLLCAGMPLKSLKFVSEEEDSEHLNELLDYLILNFTRTLTDLHLEFESATTSDLTLLDLVRSCPKLASLYFSGVGVHWRTLLEICRLKATGTLKLERLEIEKQGFMGEADEAEENFSHFIEQYEKKFKVLRVKTASE